MFNKGHEYAKLPLIHPITKTNLLNYFAVPKWIGDEEFVRGLADRIVYNMSDNWTVIENHIYSQYFRDNFKIVSSDCEWNKVLDFKNRVQTRLRQSFKV